MQALTAMGDFMAQVQINKQKESNTLSRNKSIKFYRQKAYNSFHLTQSDNNDPRLSSDLLSQAKLDIREALELDPDNGDSLNLLARIELENGHYFEAQEAINHALMEAPNNGGYWYSAGHIALAQQEFNHAQSAFQKAIRYAPKETRAEVSLAYTLAQNGKIVEAFQQYRELAKTQGQDLHIRSQVVNLASQIQADYYDPELEQDLLSYMQWDKANLDQLGTLVCSLLEFKFELNQKGSAAHFDIIANCPLFLSALRLTLIKSEILEKLIMSMRHELLTISTQQGQISKSHIQLSQAISQYGQRNEYILPETEAETGMVNMLESVINQSLSQFGCTALDISGALLLLSMYKSWLQLEQFPKLMSWTSKDWPDETYQLRIWHDEVCKLEHYTFEKITPIPNCKENKVKSQYEQFPYPRWRTLDYKKNINYGIALRHEYKHVNFPQHLFDANLKILIAGCGTGRHALNVAKYFYGVEVLGIDISQNSLAYAKHMATEFDINNVEFKLADITKLPMLKEKFNIIECSGVLHHIRHYKKALHNLLNNLKPNGLIKISLYSRRTREPVTQVRSIFKQDKNSLDRHRVQVIRQAIMQSNLIDNKIGITQSDDFYSMSGTVDMLFHEYEKHYTPLSIKQLCQEFNLTWLGFSNLSPKTKHDFLSFHGTKADMLDLKQWDEFEEQYPHTFSNMFQFYCQYKPNLKLNIKTD